MQKEFSNLLIEFTRFGIYCRRANAYIDPSAPAERAIITHSHSDHAKRGCRSYLTAERNVRILKHRIGKAEIQGAAYGESVIMNGVRISFHPAGHIPGSSQVRLEHKGEVCVVSGDYKTEGDNLTEKFEPVRCHTFVTESTFALPVFNWRPQENVLDAIVNWWKRNRECGLISVISAYSLGKSQRLICGLLEYVDKLYVHSSIEEVNKVLRISGYKVPEVLPVPNSMDRKKMKGALMIVPPSYVNSAEASGEVPMVSAFASGWMAVRGGFRRRGQSAGFALSDHADWKGLNTAIRETGASKVFVVHGFTDVLSRWLNESGIEAYDPHSYSFLSDQRDNV